MTKVENGYFMSDEDYNLMLKMSEDYNLMLEKFEEIENGLNKLSEMLDKMEKILEDTQRDIKEIKASHDRMNACMDRIESNMQ